MVPPSATHARAGAPPAADAPLTLATPERSLVAVVAGTIGLPALWLLHCVVSPTIGILAALAVAAIAWPCAFAFATHARITLRDMRWHRAIVQLTYLVGMGSLFAGAFAIVAVRDTAGEFWWRGVVAIAIYFVILGLAALGWRAQLLTRHREEIARLVAEMLDAPSGRWRHPESSSIAAHPHGAWPLHVATAAIPVTVALLGAPLATPVIAALAFVSPIALAAVLALVRGEVLTTLVVHRAIQRSGLPASHLAFLDLPRVERQRSELRRVVRDLLAPRAGTALRPSRPTRIAGTMAVAVSPVPVSADAPAPPVQRLLAPVPAAAARPAPGDLAVPVPLFLDLAAPARTVPSRVAALVAVEHLVADRSSVTAPRVPLRRMDRLATDHRPVAPIAERIDLTAAGLAILGDDFSFGDAHSDDALPRGRATAGPPLSPFARGRIASVDVQLNDTGRALLGDLFD